MMNERTITQTTGEDRGLKLVVDVYDVLRAFEVTDPAIQDAVKKLLCPGIRNITKSQEHLIARLADLFEAIKCIQRAIDTIAADEAFGKSPETKPRDLPNCPFKIGDVICMPLRVTGFENDSLTTVSDDQYETPARVSRRYWSSFVVIKEAAVDKPDETCPFQVGDIICKPWRITGFDGAPVLLGPREVDFLVVVSNDQYEEPSHIPRQSWPRFVVIRKLPDRWELLKSEF
jgi:hypothetical protein